MPSHMWRQTGNCTTSTCTDFQDSRNPKTEWKLRYSYEAYCKNMAEWILWSEKHIKIEFLKPFPFSYGVFECLKFSNYTGTCACKSCGFDYDYCIYSYRVRKGTFPLAFALGKSSFLSHCDDEGLAMRSVSRCSCNSLCCSRCRAAFCFVCCSFSALFCTTKEALSKKW